MMRFYLMAAVVGFCSTGAFKITPQARLLVDAFADAARALRYQRKEVAAFQGLDDKQWARQFAAEEGQHVSAYRLALAPAPVIREWIKRIAPAFGLRVFDRQDDIVRLIDATNALASNYESLTHESDRRRA